MLSLHKSAAVIGLLLVCAAVLITHPAHAAKKKVIDHKVLSKAPKAPLAKLNHLSAYDGTALAFRRYLPRDPKAILLFYHSIGLHSSVGYNHLAYNLAKNHGIGVITPDLRGHGKSAGEPGDAPGVDAFWHDIDSFIDYIHIYHPDMPVYLGGHAGAASLILNYVSEFPRAPVQGLVFLSPSMGADAKLGRRMNPPFSTMDTKVKIYNKATFGLLCGHCSALKLNYPHPLKVYNRGVVTDISANTAKAFTPDNTKMQVRKLRIPFAVWMGSKDEVNQGGRTKMFFKQNGRKPWLEENALIKGATHLSVLLKAGEHIGPWLAGRKVD